MLFLGIATTPVTYPYTIGIRLPFGGLEDGCEVAGTEEYVISRCRNKATKKCFSSGVPRLCACHEGEMCPACSIVRVGSNVNAAGAQILGFPFEVTCLLLVLSSKLHLALNPVLAPPPSPLRPNDHSNIKCD